MPIEKEDILEVLSDPTLHQIRFSVGLIKVNSDAIMSQTTSRQEELRLSREKGSLRPTILKSILLRLVLASLRWISTRAPMSCTSAHTLPPTSMSTTLPGFGTKLRPTSRNLPTSCSWLQIPKNLQLDCR
jgi:hypothetical protein